MTHLRFSRFFSFFISLALLLSPLPLAAIAQDLMVVSMSELEAELMMRHSDTSYVYLGKELSNIAQVVLEISVLDNDKNSPLFQLKTAIENGFSLAQHENVADALHYAETLLRKKYSALNHEKAEQIFWDLENVMRKFLNGLLMIETIEQYNQNATRPFTNIIQVQGLLSVNDELVQNITAVNLSATDAVITDATIGTLSITDALVVNVTVTNLSVIDLVAQNIQATNISVVDETVTGTLSANDAIIATSLKFQDASTDYVGIEAPTTVSTYTVALPAAAPTANQLLQANISTPTNLQWATDSAFVTPANSETIYVAIYGNDTTGNGSLATPYATVAKAIDVANGLASSLNPITISIGTGIYIEDNSASPLTVTAAGVAIIGQVSSNVILMPNTPANDFFLINVPIHISDVTFESSDPLATGITLASGTFTAVINVDFVNFLVGVECVGSPSNSYGLIDCFFVDNGTGLLVSNAYVAVDNITLFGTSSPSGPSANNAITATGSGANLVINGGVIALCETGITLLSNAAATVTGIAHRLNVFDINQSGASNLVLSACSFELTTSSSDIEIQASGAGTVTEIVGCNFDGSSMLGVSEGTGILVTDNAFVNLNSGSMSNYTTALSVGLSTDTASTSLIASSFIVLDCTNAIIQQGSASLNFNASTASSSKISINDSTNVNMAFFDLDDSNALTVGSFANQDTSLLQAAIASSTNPEIQYKAALYSTEGIGFYNPSASASSLFVQSSENANLTAMTTTRTDVAGLRLVSDTAVPVGGTTALRGWDVNKNASTAELAFKFQNSDTVGESAVSEYTVMQLDGFNNLLQLPTAGTKIVFDTDTNLYRSAASVLKTDSNFIVGTLTPGTVVITDPSTNELESSVTTSTELSYVHGVTSAIQTQLNSKLPLTGGTLTGTLTIPAGSATAPSLQFTGSTNTGLSAATANVLSFDANGIEQMNVSTSGVTIDAFSTAGVVHNSSAGLLSSSLIVNADITPGTIANSSLATIDSADTPGAIVVRDGSGNFDTNMITIDGTVTNPTDVATKAYVDAAVSTGLIAKTPCIVVSTNDTDMPFNPPTGPATIDGYTVVTGDRILLVGQSSEVYNGIWLANTAGLWTYPSDWMSGTTAGEAYVLITSGTVNAGSSWLCSTPTATIGTSDITFAEFALPSPTTGANVGGGSGQVYQGKTGITLNFRTLSVADTYLTIVTNSDNVGFSTNATSANTASKIVARDSLGNFSASTITANLTGHASLDLPLTGGTLTGSVTVPAGTVVSPSIKFTGSATGTGISAPSANVISVDISGTEQMNISSAGVVVDTLLSVNDEIITGTLQIGSLSTGVLHSDSSGDITSSLIVDADITTGTITNDKLANISSSNIANDIVVRDPSGNFAANTITATLTGHASGDLPLTGGTLTGTLTLPAGTTALPSLVFTGSTTTGLSAVSGTLSFSTSAVERMKIASGGTISIDAFTAPGVIHNDASGNLSSSLIVNADISATAGITDSKLATISTAGKVANSATTATNSNIANAIVARDASGSFAAGLISVTDEVISSTVTITPFSTAGVIHNNSSGLLSSSLIVDADITSMTITNDKLANISSSNIANDIVLRDGSGNFAAGTITATLTGHASGDLPLTGGTLTGTLTLPAGSATSPSLQFTGSTSTGLSAATANTLSFDTNGAERMNISATGGITIDGFGTAGVVHNSAAGLLSTSLIVDADITAATITNDKLANISSSNIANDIVVRDGSGSFAAQEISMNDGILAGNLILTTEPSTSTAGNIIKGSSRFIHDFGTNNLFMGINAGNFTTSGSGSNIGIGTSALTANGTGAFNTAVGYQALAANTKGVDNTAFGYNALSTCSTDKDNTAIGYNTLAVNAGGFQNTAVGSGALAANTMGGDNTAIGYQALLVNNEGGSNTAIGNSALSSNLTGTNNIAIGVSTLGANTVGHQNVGVGDGALSSNVTGFFNVAIGVNALESSTVSSNTAVGFSALQMNTTGVGNTALGAQALNANNVGSSNTAVGSALVANTAGNFNTAIGQSALAMNVTGASNTAIGYNTLSAVTTGSTNIAIGASAGGILTTGSGNIYIGLNALTATEANTTRIANIFGATPAAGALVVAIDSNGMLGTTSSAATGTSLNTPNTLVARDGTGSFAAQEISMNDGILAGNLILSTEPSTSTMGNIIKGSSSFIHDFGTNNLFMGINAGNFTMSGSGGNIGIGTSVLTANTTGTFNTAVGYQTLAANTVGTHNTALGYNALAVSTTGTDNTAIGYNALAANATGTGFNTAVGSGALTANTTGVNNVAVGVNALVSNTTGINNVAIGRGTLASNVTGISNTGIGQGALNANTANNNTAVGTSALGVNTTGTSNIAVGVSALGANTVGIQNTALGYNALAVSTTGTDNTAIGYLALAANATGTSANTAVGSSALAVNTTGTSNVAVGFNALGVNTIGGSNTAIGRGVLAHNVTGGNNTAVGEVALNANVANNNTAVGQGALTANTTGTRNSAVGALALTTNIIGTDNTAVGFQALNINTGSQNVAVGSNALELNQTGGNNTAVGFQALLNNTVGFENTAVGASALLNTTGSTGNTAVGFQALLDNTIGSNNTAVGLSALQANTTGAQNTAIGQGALLSNTTGTLNTAIGAGALQDNSFGSDNTACGYIALLSNTTGVSNTAVGNSALNANTIGVSNTAVGVNALLDNTTGGSNTAVGVGALQDNIGGTNNTAVGVQALLSNTTGSNNTAVGLNSLFTNTIGIQNTAVGVTALLATTTGTGNAALGFQALTANTTGSNNTACGQGALIANTIGNENVAVGINALPNVTAGGFNIGIGFDSGNGLISGNSNIYIGQSIAAISSSESNVTRISNIDSVNIGAQPAVLITNTGQLGINTSTRKIKHAIEDMDDESANILQLRPVTFVYNSDETETKQYGLIAEEVDEIFPGIVSRDRHGEIQTVLYNVLPVLLLNEMKKQQATIEQQQITIDNLVTVEQMTSAISSLQAQIEQFVERIKMLESQA